MGTITDAVYFNKLKSDCGAITHSGDVRDGKPLGYDELVDIDGAKIDYNISYLAILVTSQSENGF